MSISIGERIRELRRRSGLTQEQLALSLDLRLTQAQVSRWERGVHEPELRYLRLMARVFGVGVEELAGVAGSP